MSEEKEIVKIIKRAVPSIVSIVSEPDLNKKKDFFDIFSPKETREKTSLIGGSGFFVSKNGLLVTNLHVVKKPGKYYILNYQQEKVPAKIISTDDLNDVAFLKAEIVNSKPIELGDSNFLEIGQVVLAIGTSLGLFQNSVSKGIISGISRTIVAQSGKEGDKELYGLIQTDAAINPGNSGGPLINSKGKVIGINTATVFGVENIGFALPINAIKDDLEELLSSGQTKRLNLGIHYSLLDSSISRFINLPVKKGAFLISRPAKNSPAELAGLKEGDVILEIEGVKITPKATIRKIIRELNKRSLSLKVWRQGKILKLNLSTDN